MYIMKKRRVKRRNKLSHISRKSNVNLKDNIVRKMSNYLNQAFDLKKLKGVAYFNIHLYIIFAIGFIAFFTTSVYYLIVLLIIVSLDAISIVFLHECPLTLMEKKYLGFTSSEMRDELFECAGILYKCDHNYEKQIELLINVWTIIATKCVSVILLQMFDIKLFDVGNIYS